MRAAAPDLVGTVAAIMASAPPQMPWFYEGMIRAGLRAMACLDGRPWQRADRQAERTVEQARRLAGIADPTLLGWDSAETDPRCAHCRRPFVPSARSSEQLYCSPACASSGANARRTHPRPLPETCEQCGGPMDAKSPRRKFCSTPCRREAEKEQWDARMEEQREADPDASWRERRQRALEAAA